MAVQNSAGGYNAYLKKMRHREYPQLSGTTYLDHAGTTLYPASTINAFAKDMSTNLFGNPHSASPSSALSTTRVSEVRRLVLERFKADPKHFDLIFVANATAAIKLVSHAFQDHGYWYGFHADAHTSLVGVRELATHGHRCFATKEEVDSWIDSGINDEAIPRLFGYPAQSNMTGYRLPLNWGGKIRAKTASQKFPTYTLLDAASYLTSGNLDLSDHTQAPDFITLSFYKIFGFPDLGALIVRKESSNLLLSRKYFGGGTVEMVTAIGDSWHQLHRSEIHEALEDGTLPFHNIVALHHAMDTHNRLFGTPSQCSDWASHLTEHGYKRLSNLTHYNGVRVLQIYKSPHAQFGDARTQGPIISFSIRSHLGKIIGKSRFEALAIAAGIQLRTGGVCNPGGIEAMLDLDSWEMKRNFMQGMSCGNSLDVIGGKPTGIIRISLAPITTREDVDRFVEFVKEFFVVDESEKDLPRRQFAQNSQPPIPLITPITGCLPIEVLSEDFHSTVEAEAAYIGFHEQWFIKDLSTGKRISNQEETLQKLKLKMEFDENQMTISYIGPNRQLGQQNSIVVELWKGLQIPKHISAATPTSMSEIQCFFTSITDTPTTLGHRLQRLDQKSSPLKCHICVVWWCGTVFKTAEDLHQHYCQHGQNFQGSHAEKCNRKKETSKMLRSQEKAWLKTGFVNVSSFSEKSTENFDSGIAKMWLQGRKEKSSFSFRRLCSIRR
ncbi:hypothetical protein LTR84_001253 [Exophiala bonariae]|uniref:C2H2-type domain-containing protein n=1 Tax=Exophiala bonariae TaxID=1690606 RepID=A0AAV9NWT8_9EURO|nr:hypothetical protein LTR84_001253 [Exophiala bonariae]